MVRPPEMALKLESDGRDIAVIDIEDVLNLLAMDLTPKELRNSVNKVYEYLANPRLCGIASFKQAYLETVRDWLDIFDGKNPDGERIEGRPC